MPRSKIFRFRVSCFVFRVSCAEFRVSGCRHQVCCQLRNHAFVCTPYYQPRPPQLPPSCVFVLGMKSGKFSSILGCIRPFMRNDSSLGCIVPPCKRRKSPSISCMADPQRKSLPPDLGLRPNGVGCPWWQKYVLEHRAQGVKSWKSRDTTCKSLALFEPPPYNHSPSSSP